MEQSIKPTYDFEILLVDQVVVQISKSQTLVY